MTFKNVYLLSQVERRALAMEFQPGVTVVRAGNGFGKSALLKSLYDTFGAEPHQIDESWRKANVISAVDFEIDGLDYTIMKVAGTYAVFNAKGKRELVTSSVTHDLAPYMAELLDFRLLMTDQREEVLVPPPAYAFAPFYVDQDKSWSSAWEPFRSMYLPRSGANLSEYHSGLRPNAYYVAKAERDRLAAGLKEAEVRRVGLSQAMEHLRAIAYEAPIYFNLEDFKAETESLLTESARLHEEEVRHRAKLSEINEARTLWFAQTEVTRAALAEFDEMFKSATGHPVDVECPTCGEHYTNDVAARFNIAADTEALIGALQYAQGQKRQLDKKLETVQGDIKEIAVAIARVQSVLSTKRNDLTLGEVVAAEGRNAATRALRQRIEEVDGEIGAFTSHIDEQAAEMRRSMDRKRSNAIRDFFAARLVSFSQSLDVRVSESDTRSIYRKQHARGSEGPRSLAAYYFAFLHTTREFGSSAFCPIVIDAPNQQGQDAVHLPAILSFLVNKRPKGAQLILGVEEAVGIDGADARIVDIGERKNQLLSENYFEPVEEHLRPFLTQLVA